MTYLAFSGADFDDFAVVFRIVYDFGTHVCYVYLMFSVIKSAEDFLKNFPAVVTLLLMNR